MGITCITPEMFQGHDNWATMEKVKRKNVNETVVQRIKMKRWDGKFDMQGWKFEKSTIISANRETYITLKDQGTEGN